MKKRTYITKAEKEQLNEFQAGRLDMICWLENQFEKELCELETTHTSDVLYFDLEEFAQAQAKLRIFQHYLQQIKKLKGQIKNG